MEFVIIGDLSRSKKDIENTIKKLGGKVAPRVHYKLAAVISNQDEIQRMSNQMTEAKAFDIQVVSEDFLTDIQQNKDPILHIITEKLCSWGGDVNSHHFEIVQYNTTNSHFILLLFDLAICSYRKK